MKLPYSETYCFYLENTDDLGLFDKYINPALSPSVWGPLPHITRMDIPLPQYVHIIKQPVNLSWHYNPEVFKDKTLLPLDALFNAEQYPELFI